MSNFEKKLCIFAIVFVTIYLGAVVITIQSRINAKEAVTRLESAKPGPGEGQIMLAELFLPMMILLTVTVSFIIVRKKRAKDITVLEDSKENIQKIPADIEQSE